MTPFGHQSRTCERAREWVSLALDGELSELGHARVSSHLAACAACSAYAADIERTTKALRDAPLASLGAAVALPARRRPALASRAYQVAGVAAILAAAVGIGSQLGASSSRSESTSVSRGALVENVAEDTLLRAPRLAMINAVKGLGTQRGIGIVDI
jgi:anti-sigma factor RsiW